jgi:hypothetical protein
MADGPPASPRLRGTLSTAASVLLVLAAYAFFGSLGSFDFPRVTDWKVSNYASLAEGFRNGHLHLDQKIDSRLMLVPYPWDPRAREGIYYHWDVSYLNGRYYLYFTPLPALFIYIPFRLLLGAYPSDALVAALLSTWVFLAAVAFLRRALSGSRSLIPMPLWIIAAGLGNILPFLLTHVGMYEIAILTGTAMTSMWALAVLSFVRKPTSWRAVAVGSWLALAIAARPNLGVLLIASAWVIVRELRETRAALVRAAAGFVAPLAVVAALLIAYNYARFNEPFEFGLRYQLTSVDMKGQRVCGVCSVPEAMRLANHTMHYLFWSPAFRAGFPYVEMQPARLDAAVVWPRQNDATEQMIGILPLFPLVAVGMLFAIVFAEDQRLRAARRVIFGGLLVLFSLASCWWVVSRYSLDFFFLLVPASIACVERGLSRLREMDVRVGPLRAGAAALACYSACMGVLLGFEGPGEAFRRANPELFERIAGWLS